MAARVVADHRADVLRHLVDAPEEVFDGLPRQLGVLFERGVGVGDVRGVVFVVMDLHRPRVDVRLEGVECVGKLRQLERHRLGPPFLN